MYLQLPAFLQPGSPTRAIEDIREMIQSPHFSHSINQSPTTKNRKQDIEIERGIQKKNIPTTLSISLSYRFKMETP